MIKLTKLSSVYFNSKDDLKKYLDKELKESRITQDVKTGVELQGHAAHTGKGEAFPTTSEFFVTAVPHIQFISGAKDEGS